MPTCKVLGCTVGYASNPDKGPCFSTPKDLHALVEWRKATKLPNLKSGDAVCHHHFQASEILTHKVIKHPDGSVIMKIPYKCSRLQKGAVPSQFQWTIDGSSSSSQMDHPEVLMGAHSYVNPDTPPASDSSSDIEYGKFGGSSRPSTIHSLKRDADTIPEVQTPHATPAPSTSAENVGNESYKGKSSPIRVNQLAGIKFKDLGMKIVLPTDWSFKYLLQHNRAILVLSKESFSYLNGKYQTYKLKEILITQDFEVKVSILQEDVDLSKFHCGSELLSIEMLQQIICTVDKARVCCGSHTQEKMPVTDCKTVQQDAGATWRHVGCPLIVTDSRRCSYCRRAMKTVAKRVQRLKKNETSKKNRVSLSPKIRQQWRTMKTRVQNSMRRRKLAAKTIEQLKKELEDCQVKVAQVEQSKLTELLDTGRISSHQLVLLEQIIASVKCKNANGQRYSEEWMVLALLLHMKSPATYRLLKSSEILPLPSIRTIRRYNIHFTYTFRCFHLFWIKSNPIAIFFLQIFVENQSGLWIRSKLL